MKVFQPLQDRINAINESGFCNLEDFNPIDDPKNFKCYIFDFQITAEAMDILKAAFKIIANEDNPQIKAKLQRIENIAKGIMFIEKAEAITPEIISEAIQYVI